MSPPPQPISGRARGASRNARSVDRRLLAGCAAGVCLTVTLLAPAAPATGGGAPPFAVPGASDGALARSVYVQGDSITAGMSAELRRLLTGYRVRISARTGRTLAQGLRIARKAAATMPPIVVVGLGTNDDVERPRAFAGGARTLLRLAGPRRCVLWIDLYRRTRRRSDPGFGPLNRILLALRADHPRLVVVRWSRLAGRHPAWFPHDAVHPTEAGYLALARAVARAVRRCPGATRPTDPNTPSGGGAPSG